MKLVSLAFQLFFLFLFSASTIAQDWKTIHTFNTAQTIPTIMTIGDETIIAASALYNGTDLNIKRSDDNGQTWKEQASGYLQMNFRGIDSPDGLDVFVIGNAGALIHNNGMDTWTSIDLQTTNNLRSIHFVNERIGFIGLDRGVILKTDDGGDTWTDIQANVEGVSSVSNIHFIDENHGFIAGFNYMQVSFDGGSNWSYVQGFEPQPGQLFQLQEVQFLNDQVGYTCGDVGLMYKTTDGGTSWTQQTTGTTESLQDMKFINESVGFACGFEGTIIYTLDGGENWLPMTADDSEHFRSIDINPTRGFLTTQRGSILALDNIPDLVSVLDLPELSFSASPNPTSDEVKLQSKQLLSSYNLYDSFGQLIESRKVSGHDLNVNVNSFPKGTYYIGLFSNQGEFGMKKLVKK